jgi:ATP-dependent Clp protease ATP-binding subunit ClpA
MLEYYSGILILTTNRVGIFDEAFKSRIQLAIRYHDLNQEQRRKIWRNFFNMLDETEESVNKHDLEMNVAKLADVKINGRQIRNAVTTARHLARFRKERLVYQHLLKAIELIKKFDEYITDVNQGVTDERLARESQLR